MNGIVSGKLLVDNGVSLEGVYEEVFSSSFFLTKRYIFRVIHKNKSKRVSLQETKTKIKQKARFFQIESLIEHLDPVNRPDVTREQVPFPCFFLFFYFCFPLLFCLFSKTFFLSKKNIQKILPLLFF